MPIPQTFIAQQDLEDALTAEKLRELLGDKGKPEANPRRIKLCIEQGQGFVLGHIQRAVQPKSIDVLWDTVWGDRDKAETRRLVLSASLYYVHLFGQKEEDVPDSVTTERDYVEERAKAIGDHLATVGADPDPASSTQHVINYSPGAGNTLPGQPRNKWVGF